MSQLPTSQANKGLVEYVQKQALTVSDWRHCCADIMLANDIDSDTVIASLTERAKKLVSYPLLAQIGFGLVILLSSYFSEPTIMAFIMSLIPLYLASCGLSQILYQCGLQRSHRAGNYIGLQAGIGIGAAGTLAMTLICMLLLYPYSSSLLITCAMLAISILYFFTSQRTVAVLSQARDQVLRQKTNSHLEQLPKALETELATILNNANSYTRDDYASIKTLVASSRANSELMAGHWQGFHRSDGMRPGLDQSGLIGSNEHHLGTRFDILIQSTPEHTFIGELHDQGISVKADIEGSCRAGFIVFTRSSRGAAKHFTSPIYYIGKISADYQIISGDWHGDDGTSGSWVASRIRKEKPSN
jgi:hypothetical protein